ncbi:hypothetical protein MTR67_051819 [Solanum verrucosum]|uniref:Uncharacterized protein n=1 Tax=Solanum verrucosum TaxID=315347 RepID=A0AAF0V6Y4_SOLVR|nr:hypothetical protein MTR67_051819 [Solanum verrucosum]
MVSDSIPTPMASDFVKKRGDWSNNTCLNLLMSYNSENSQLQVNRSAKLKQCKLYARRDLWLSQGNVGRNQAPATNIENERDRFIDKFEIKSTDHEVNNDSINHYSHSDSNSNSPITHTSNIMEGNDFAGSSSSCNGTCSASLSEEDDHRDDDDDRIDDWEAIADALDAIDQKLEQHHPGSDSCLERDESQQHDYKNVELRRSEDEKIPELKGDDGKLLKTHNVCLNTAAAPAEILYEEVKPPIQVIKIGLTKDMIIPEDIGQQEEICKIEIPSFYANKRTIGISTIIQKLANNYLNGNAIWSYYARDQLMIYFNSRELRKADMDEVQRWILSLLKPEERPTTRALKEGFISAELLTRYCKLIGHKYPDHICSKCNGEDNIIPDVQLE